MRFLTLTILAMGAITAWACEADYTIWIPRTLSADPLYRFVKNGKAGYIDAKGNVVLPPRLAAYGNSGSEFHDGLLMTSIDGGKYIDRTGKLAINGAFGSWDFSEGLAVARREGEKLLGYIDTSGKFAISPRFKSSALDSVWSFSEGVARIQVNGKFGFIDHSGQFVISPHLPDAIDFHEGMTRVVLEGSCAYLPDGPCASPQIVGNPKGVPSGCKFTFINKAGVTVTKARFDFARDFSEGLAPVRIANLWGFIDRTGKLVIPPQFEDAESFHAGLSRIRMDGKYGYADNSGAIIVEPQYEYADDFSEGFAAVGSKTAGYWYINQQGKTAFRQRFAKASPFFKGLAHVKFGSQTKGRGEGFAYVDHTGRSVFTY